jgi:hypothetical protein
MRVTKEILRQIVDQAECIYHNAISMLADDNVALNKSSWERIEFCRAAARNIGELASSGKK